MAILTPPLVKLEQTLSDCLQAGETSLCVYGAYRSGKTTAALYLRNTFAAQNVLFLLLQMGEPEEGSKKMPDFWARLRAANGNRRYYTETTSRETLINDLEVDADSRNNRLIIIAVDEAQKLAPVHVGMLKDVTDQLINEGYSPFALLFAQPEVQNLTAKLYKLEMGDSVDRFLTQWHYYRGLSLREIPEVLAAYDALTFPAASEITFSAHFAPSLWRDGWRLADEAPTFQREFKKVFEKFKLGDTPELGTKYLITAVRWLLTTLIRNEKTGKLMAPSSYISECVSHSGLSEFYRMTKEHRRGDFRARLDMEP